MIKIAYDTIYAHPLPEGHRFPMLKYELIPEQLLHEGTIENEHLFVPEICALTTVLQTHETEYVNKLLIDLNVFLLVEPSDSKSFINKLLHGVLFSCTYNIIIRFILL